MQLQLSLVWFAWRNLGRRRLRTGLTLCGIGMAIGAFVALVGFSKSFEREWLKAYETTGTEIAVLEKAFLNTSVNESAGATLGRLPDVAQVSPMILNMIDLTPEVNALAYGLEATSYEFSSFTITSGRLFHDGQQELILGELLAQSLGKQAGDTLEIQGSQFHVTGIFHGGSALQSGALILPLDEMQQISSLQGKVTAFHVRLKPAPAGTSEENFVKEARAQIEAALPGLKAVPASELASKNQIVVLAHAAAWGTSAIAIFIGILGIANTMAMSVFERTREIGILRALGWKSWRVLLLIQLEASALGLTGGLLGIVFGWAALKALSAFPQTASIVSADFSPLLLAEALGVAVLAGLLAGAIPAWRGAHLSPVEALRHD